VELRQVIVFHAFPNGRRLRQAQIVSAMIALRDGLRITWQTLKVDDPATALTAI
jgi:hypothetical protein